MRLKQKADEDAEAEEDEPRKKVKQEEGEKLQAQLADMASKALYEWIKDMDEGTNRIWQATHGDTWEDAKRFGAMERDLLQKEHQEKVALFEESARKRKAAERVSLRDPEVFLDDLDPRS